MEKFGLTDGSSDAVLLRPLSWLLRQFLRPDVRVQPRWADLRSLRRRPANLAQRIQRTMELYPCDLMFIHRDAEGEDAAVRYAEIARAADEAQPGCYVAVVPVRMTEAWLLFDEMAIRRAAGNPHGRQPISIPFDNPESLPNPKHHLHQALRLASGLRGRRLERFKVALAVHRVGEYIVDYSALRHLKAFQRLEHDVNVALAAQDLKSPRNAQR